MYRDKETPREENRESIANQQSHRVGSHIPVSPAAQGKSSLCRIRNEIETWNRWNYWRLWRLERIVNTVKPRSHSDQNRIVLNDSSRALLVFHDRVGQRADAGDFDVDEIAVFEREFIGGDDAGACEQEGSVGEVVIPAEPADEVVEVANHLT